MIWHFFPAILWARLRSIFEFFFYVVWFLSIFTFLCCVFSDRRNLISISFHLRQWEKSEKSDKHKNEQKKIINTAQNSHFKCTNGSDKELIIDCDRFLLHFYGFSFHRRFCFWVLNCHSFSFVNKSQLIKIKHAMKIKWPVTRFQAFT